MGSRRFDHEDYVPWLMEEFTLDQAVEGMKVLAAIICEMHEDAYDSDAEGRPQFCDCVRRRVYAALDAFARRQGATAARAIARDGKQHLCPRHAAAPIGSVR